MTNTVNLAEKFTNSDRFKTLFQDGMTLVEESASYLDGKGRENTDVLERNIAMLYGTQSMKLTTRLMQIASWLLLQRAANEGEMTKDQLLEEKKKVKLEEHKQEVSDEEWRQLPDEFTQLVSRSMNIQQRVISLDNELYNRKAESEKVEKNPVTQQIDLLSTALGASKE